MVNNRTVKRNMDNVFSRPEFSRLLLSSIIASVASGAALMPMQAQAEELMLEEVIVTATKRDENLQDVAMTITAFSGQKLELYAIDDFIDIATQVPGLSFVSQSSIGSDSGGNRTVALRGIAASPGFGEDTTGFYLDNTVMKFIEPKYVDVKRIEVLKGPQGSLWGSSAMGGVIRVITNDPDSQEFSARLGGTLSSTTDGGNNVGLNGVVNIPISEGLAALRITGFSREDDGFIDNVRPDMTEKDVNDESTWGGRVKLLLTPTEDLDIIASIFTQELEFDADAQDIFGRPGLSFEWYAPNLQAETYDIYDITVNYDFESMTLTSTSSWSEFDHRARLDSAFLLGLVGPGLPVGNINFNNVSDRFVQELRLTSTTESPLQWMVGAFYSEDERSSNTVWFVDGWQQLISGGGPFDPARDLLFDQLVLSDIEEKSFYAQLSYDLTEKLTVSVSARRYDFQSDRRAGHIGGSFIPGWDPAAGVLPTPAADGIDEDGVTPRASISYQINDDQQVFLTYSEGFRAGLTGSTPPRFADPACAAVLEANGIVAGTDVESDSIKNYEVGYKSLHADGRVKFNAAAYQIDWTDYQQTVSFPECGGGVPANSGDIEIQGVELEFSAQIGDSLLVNGTYSYTGSEYLTLPPAGAEIGDPVQSVTPHQFSIDGTYNFTIGGYDSYASASYSRVAEARMRYGFRSTDRNWTHRSEYAMVSARLGVNLGKWDVSLFGTNLKNEHPALGGNNILGTEVASYTLRPRTIGLELNVSL